MAIPLDTQRLSETPEGLELGLRLADPVPRAQALIEGRHLVSSQTISRPWPQQCCATASALAPSWKSRADSPTTCCATCSIRCPRRDADPFSLEANHEIFQH